MQAATEAGEDYGLDANQLQGREESEAPGVRTGPWTQEELDAGARVETASGVRIVLGDQQVEAMGSRLKDVGLGTIKDLFTPSGWDSIATDLKTNGKALSGGPGFVGFGDLFEPRLLLTMPVALFRYIAAIYIKSGNNVRVPIFLWCFGLAYFGTVVDDEARASIPEFLGAIALTAGQTVVLARVFLVLLLGDRNEILADSITR